MYKSKSTSMYFTYISCGIAGTILADIGDHLLFLFQYSSLLFKLHAWSMSSNSIQKSSSRIFFIIIAADVCFCQVVRLHEALSSMRWLQRHESLLSLSLAGQSTSPRAVRTDKKRDVPFSPLISSYMFPLLQS